MQNVGPSLAAPLVPLAHRRNVASFRFFIGITLVDVLLNWLHWFQFFFLEGGLLVILIDCMIDVTIPGCYKDVYVIGFNSGINRHLLAAGSF